MNTTEESADWAQVYSGAVLRVLNCKHRGGAKRRGKKCEESVIIAYDDPALTEDFEVIHPSAPYGKHVVRRISTGDFMAKWFVEGDRVGFEMDPPATVIRIGNVLEEEPG